MAEENCCKEGCQELDSGVCCRRNSSHGENCCCKVCGDDKSQCYYKQIYGVCRSDVPCQKGLKRKPAMCYEEFKGHKNPDLPWLDWHFRPMITCNSTDKKHYHYHLKRRAPAIGDVYFHELPEDHHHFR